jgi:hypothetical protein
MLAGGMAAHGIDEALGTEDAEVGTRCIVTIQYK